MLTIFESILPIFLVVGAGAVLRRIALVDNTLWPGLEQLCYWFLYPALLFITILNADFSGLRVGALLAALLMAIALMIALVAALWPAIRSTAIVEHGEFSSLFQTAIRWNGFMALAVAEKIFPTEGAAVVALVMAVIIVPINVASVFVVTRFADRGTDWAGIARSMALNPLILGAGAAIVLRLLSIEVYGPLNEALDLVGRAALGMGLLVVGAGLRIGDIARPRPAVAISAVLKLVLFPLLLIGIAVAIGVTGNELRYLALCASVPTALNGYVLARQLGGDAELYAATATVQTALAFFTMPAVLALSAYIASG